MKTIYLDNSATTPLLPTVCEAMRNAMETYGNPSSLHTMGQSAHALVEDARRAILRSLGQRGTHEAGQLIFTSCGSEADNLAILGTAYAKPRRRSGRVISTEGEHAAVEQALRALEADGFEVVRISTRGGELDWEQYEKALNDRTFLVTMMMVNNETGAFYDLGRAFAMAKAKDSAIVTHTDAVQGYLKCRFTPAALRADLVTLSAHKIGGPKGVGALYVSPEALKRRDLRPWLLGGGQENGFRSGTENVLGIVGFGEAARVGFDAMTANTAAMKDLREAAIARLAAMGLQVNLPRGNSAPHIVNFTLPDIKSETMLHALSAEGIYVSSGSACSSHSVTVSRALTAFGLSESMAECSLRISFGAQNTQEDIDALANALERAMERLVRIHR